MDIATGAGLLAGIIVLCTLILMGGAGLVTCISFIWLSAPDLALTQLVVEVVTTVLYLASDHSSFTTGSVIDGKPLLTVSLGKAFAEAMGLKAVDIIKQISPEIKGGGGGQPDYATAGGIVGDLDPTGGFHRARPAAIDAASRQRSACARGNVERIGERAASSCA